MDVKKPEIFIAQASDSRLFQTALYGIEEEGIPFREINDSDIENLSNMSTVEKAYQAALASQLGVGLAYDENFAYLHQKNLPKDEPLFKVSISDQEDINHLGTNAARLVKGVPFKDIKEKGE
ncbi:glycerol dehydratase reactivase beta/small subunit family protein [Companilactobacillus zhongbaensis]|uniref:glycerol dehydratase reactivase beta/small subunit family protein n=1 Tax=Companilactobacillus zhongbaensis TaxID=2486009 RepID=UPI000F7B6B12|nr:glycerol dehydratase reactivase beta/small subunit family protein [Companilactobacillus zhongbaensis]